jgi:hypothetical protein
VRSAADADAAGAGGEAWSGSSALMTVSPLGYVGTNPPALHPGRDPAPPAGSGKRIDNQLARRSWGEVQPLEAW